MINGQRADAEALWDEVGTALAPMGLRLSEAKTRVCHIDEGFDFLGWRIQRRPWRSRTGKEAVYTWPSKKSLASVMDKVRALTRRAKHRTLADLLRRLNPVLRGWCNYFRYGVSKRTFSYLGYYVFRRILGWLRSNCSATSDDGFSLPLPGHQNPDTMDEHDRRIIHADGVNMWRAGCGGSRKSGSEGGSEKPPIERWARRYDPTQHAEGSERRAGW